MGINCCSANGELHEGGIVNKNHFIKKYPIGKGGFGRVKKINNKIILIYYRYGKCNLNKIKKFML